MSWPVRKDSSTSIKYWLPSNKADIMSWPVTKYSSSSTIYWPPSTRWRLCYGLLRNIALLLSNIGRFQQGNDYISRGLLRNIAIPLSNIDRLNKVKIMSWPFLKYSFTSTKNWLPSTRWRLCHGLLGNIALLLPNTDCPQQGEDYVVAS